MRSLPVSLETMKPRSEDRGFLQHPIKFIWKEFSSHKWCVERSDLRYYYANRGVTHYQ
jgi:hypothetical protein